MAEFTDADLCKELQHSSPVASATMLADRLGVTRQAVHRRLTNLHDDGQVSKVNLGRDVGWYISQGDQEIETNNFVATARRGDGFKVDITDEENDATLLVQAGPNGYQLDLWWSEGDTRKQSNNWVRFDEAVGDYPHDNRHTRQPALTESYHGVHIHDPDPRSPSVGYDGATLRVSRVENGLHVRLVWVDEYGEQHEDISVVPLVDPRHDREAYYDIAYPDA